MNIIGNSTRQDIVRQNILISPNTWKFDEELNLYYTYFYNNPKPNTLKAIEIPRGRMKGDILNEGNITIAGYNYFMEAIAHLHDLPQAGTEDFSAWDVNGDNIVNNADLIPLVLMISMYNNEHYGSLPEVTGAWTNIPENLNNDLALFYTDITVSSSISKTKKYSLFPTFEGFCYCEAISSNTLRIYATKPPISNFASAYAQCEFSTKEVYGFNIAQVRQKQFNIKDNNHSIIPVLKKNNISKLYFETLGDQLYLNADLIDIYNELLPTDEINLTVDIVPTISYHTYGEPLIVDILSEAKLLKLPIYNPKYYTLSVPSSAWELDGDKYKAEYTHLNSMNISITIPRGRMRGDADADGKITTSDATAILKQVASHTWPEAEEDKLAYDVNNDGSLNLLDIMAAQNMASGYYGYGKYTEVTENWLSLSDTDDALHYPQFYRYVSCDLSDYDPDSGELFIKFDGDSSWYHSCSIVNENHLKICAYRPPINDVLAELYYIYTDDIDYKYFNNNSKIDIIPDDKLLNTMKIYGATELYIENDNGFITFYCDLKISTNIDVPVFIEEVIR